MLDGLLPGGLLESVLPVSSTLGGALALILGVLVFGSEYGWGTLKNILTQRTGRTVVLCGKLAALGLLLAAFVALAFAAGAVGSYGVALVEGLATRGPPIVELSKGAGALWLILAAWGAFGAFLAVLFRGSSLALGLVYALVLENMVAGLPARGEAFEVVRGALLGQSSGSLAGAFGPPSETDLMVAGQLDGGGATLVLILYALGFSLLCALVFRSRDVEQRGRRAVGRVGGGPKTRLDEGPTRVLASLSSANSHRERWRELAPRNRGNRRRFPLREVPSPAGRPLPSRKMWGEVGSLFCGRVARGAGVWAGTQANAEA